MTDVNPDDEHARLVDAIPRHRRADGTVNLTTLGAEFGLHRSNMRHRVAALAGAGALGTRPVLPSFQIKKTSTQFRNGEIVGESIQQVPQVIDVTEGVRPGFAISKISTYRSPTTTGEWIQQKPAAESPEHIAEVLKAAFADYAPVRRLSPMPDLPVEDLLAFYPLPDMHFGMFAWKAETDENWDLKIAEKSIGEAFTRVVASTPRTKRAVIMGGGDQMHSDSNMNMTAKSGNVLQVDGRYDKVIAATTRFFVTAIDLALTNHEHVDVRVLKGNHDEHSSVAIGYFLLAWYRNEPRVTVDVDPSLFWWLRFGRTFLGATHGHEAKPAKMPMIMANRRAKDWGESEHRFIHTFHVHHHELRAIEGDGVILETHQAPIPQDAWHFGAGFISGRSLQSIIYDRDDGEVGRTRRSIKKPRVSH
jgi:hypothetical protein